MLTEGQRREAGELLVALAASDGNIAPAEIDLLTRLFDALGLDRSDVSGHVHALGGDTLTRLHTAGVPAPGYAIPRSAPPEAGRRTAAVVLDPLLIEARLAESARAASYLAEIFTDDETEAVASPAPGTPNAGIGDGVAGLDAPHTALLRRLADQPRWMRGDFDNIAVELGLLPDGALETLNEAAFEAAGEPVCEGTDPIEINSYAFKETLR
jgi:TerB-C domain